MKRCLSTSDILLSFIEPTGLQFQVCTYCSESLFCCGLLFSALFIFPPFLQAPKDKCPYVGHYNTGRDISVFVGDGTAQSSLGWRPAPVSDGRAGWWKWCLRLRQCGTQHCGTWLTGPRGSRRAARRCPVPRAVWQGREAGASLSGQWLGPAVSLPSSACMQGWPCRTVSGVLLAPALPCLQGCPDFPAAWLLTQGPALRAVWGRATPSLPC